MGNLVHARGKVTMDQKVHALHRQIFLELHQHGIHQKCKSKERVSHSQGPDSSGNLSTKKRKVIDSLSMKQHEIERTKRPRRVANNFGDDRDLFESQKLFHNYLSLLGTFLAGPSGLLSECKKVLQKEFLFTRKMRSLHNELIRAIMQRALLNKVPLDYSCFIPPSWTDRIKIVDAFPKKKQIKTERTKVGIEHIVEVAKKSPSPSNLIDTGFNLEDLFNSQSGCWQPAGNVDSCLKECVMDTHGNGRSTMQLDADQGRIQDVGHSTPTQFLEGRESLQLKGNDAEVATLPQSFIFGALDLDPTIRSICTSHGLEVSAHASWAIVIAVKEMVLMLGRGAQSHTMERLLEMKQLQNSPKKKSSFLSRREDVTKIQREIHQHSYLLRQQLYQKHQESLSISSNEAPLIDASTAAPVKQSTSEAANIAIRQRRGRGMKDLLALRTARSQQNLVPVSGGNEEATSGSPAEANPSAVSQNATFSTSTAPVDGMNAPVNPTAQGLVQGVVTLQSHNNQHGFDNGSDKTMPSSQQGTASSNRSTSSADAAVTRPARRIGMKDLAALRARKLSATTGAALSATGTASSAGPGIGPSAATSSTALAPSAAASSIATGIANSTAAATDIHRNASSN